MKRIIILAIASIFIVNLLAIVPQAKVIYNNGVLTNNEFTVGASGYVAPYIKGEYVIKSTDKYKITINLPKANGQTINSFEIICNNFTTVIKVQDSEIISYQLMTNPSYENGILRFTTDGINANGMTTNLICIRYKFTQGNIVTLTYNNILTIDNNEKTQGEILIDNVQAAPKDVLREIISVLPVLLTIVIAYIATRKGIAFIRSILESA